MPLSDADRISIAAAAGVAAVALLLLGWVAALPGTPNYSDVVMYLDAAGHIGAGETPHVDFMLPFGALSAYLATLVLAVFPHAQPVLAAQYSTLLIALPAMLAATWRMKERAMAGWLWAGFALFALLPANFLSFPEPFIPSGVDGHGVYNRQAGLLLYVLISAILFSPRPQSVGVLTALGLVLIGFVKITALAFALPAAVIGLAARRIDPRAFGVSLLIGFVLVLVLQWGSGMVSAYGRDIASFASTGAEQSLFKRLAGAGMSAFMTNFLGALLLGAAAIALIAKAWEGGEKPELPEIVFNPGIGLALLVGAALVVESQNTGTQALAFLTPIGLKLAREHWDGGRAARVAAACGVIFVGLTAGVALYKGARIVKSAFEAEPVGAPVLGLSADPETAEAARAWLTQIGAGGFTPREAEMVAELDQLDSMRPISAPAFALSLEDLIADYSKWEELSRVTVRQAGSLDFVNAAALAVGLSPAAGMPAVYDPERIDYGRRAAAIAQSAAQADIIFTSLCGPSLYRETYAAMIPMALEGRTRVALDPCWVMYVRRDLPAH